MQWSLYKQQISVFYSKEIADYTEWWHKWKERGEESGVYIEYMCYNETLIEYMCYNETLI